MNKKGFTLVELLAVIAILAILVIIALPNIMSMFNQARMNSFATEVKEIYKMAQQQWISDSMLETKPITYKRIDGTVGSFGTSDTDKGLDMSGRTELDYAIQFDKAGNVIAYVATDGTYFFEAQTNPLKIEDIGTDTDPVDSLTNNNYTSATVAVGSNGEATITFAGGTENNGG